MARGTGVTGGYREKGFGALALGGFGAAVAVEAGGYYVLSEQVAPTVSRLAVQAWRVARPAMPAYAQRAAKGALVRMGLDTEAVAQSGVIPVVNSTFLYTIFRFLARLKWFRLGCANSQKQNIALL